MRIRCSPCGALLRDAAVPPHLSASPRSPLGESAHGGIAIFQDVDAQGADVDGRLGPPAAAAMNSCLQRTQQSVLGAPPRRSVTRRHTTSRPSDLASSVFQLSWRRIGQPCLKHDGADRTEPDPGNGALLAVRVSRISGRSHPSRCAWATRVSCERR